MVQLYVQFFSHILIEISARIEQLIVVGVLNRALQNLIDVGGNANEHARVQIPSADRNLWVQVLDRLVGPQKVLGPEKDVRSGAPELLDDRLQVVSENDVVATIH